MHTSSPSCTTSIIYVYQQLEVLISLNGNITMFNELSIGGLFGRAPNPAPSTTPARVLPNTSEVERLHPKDCESRKNGFACEKVEQMEPQKLAPPPPAQLRLHHFARSRSPPKRALGRAIRPCLWVDLVLDIELAQLDKTDKAGKAQRLFQSPLVM